MTARNCQLCGKPLSRIWVGTGGDFCSREHRNQYRLRLGMDRLLEANKVASLMRRRENLRLISAAHLLCESAVSPHGFFRPKISELRPEPGRFSPSLPRPRISGASESYLQPRPARLTGPSAIRRPDSSLVRLAAREIRPLAPPRRMKLRTGLRQAQLARLRDRVLGTGGKRREFGMLPHTAIRVFLGPASESGAIAPRRIEVRPAGPCRLNRVQRARHLKFHPKKGKALRVSSRLGFRLPALQVRTGKTRAALCAVMAWPEKPYPIIPGALGRPAEPRFIHIDISTLGVWCPSSPAPASVVQFKWPAAMPLARRSPYRGDALAARSAGVLWNASAPEFDTAAPSQAPAGFPAQNGRRLFAMPLAPAGAAAAQQIALVFFVPQDSVFGHAPIAIQGTIAGAMGAAPARAPGATRGPQLAPVEVPAESRLEEHFDCGWGNWVGGVEDWRLDVAGVRTGSLALFAPSLEMRDYDLEFLARIENRSVSWVFRAADFHEYYLCSIAAVAGGGYEFTRRTVTGGAAGPAVTSPLASAPNARRTITVRTRVRESGFTVSVDGNDIDSWTDSRLPLGGIGFVGASDDRARLYWVRLSSAGSSARKEYRKR
jgi:hypothetical protein